MKKGDIRAFFGTKAGEGTEAPAKKGGSKEGDQSATISAPKASPRSKILANEKPPPIKAPSRKVLAAADSPLLKKGAAHGKPGPSLDASPVTEEASQKPKSAPGRRGKAAAPRKKSTVLPAHDEDDDDDDDADFKADEGDEEDEDEEGEAEDEGDWNDEGGGEEKKGKPAAKRGRAAGKAKGKRTLEVKKKGAPQRKKEPADAAPALKAKGGGGSGWRPFMGDRPPPPHAGEKEVPEGQPNALEGLTFVLTGTLDSLEREEAEDLIKRHGGRITGAVSKKTTYLLVDEDVGGSKSKKATALGVPFLNEDGLFNLIRQSGPPRAAAPGKQGATKVKIPDAHANTSNGKKPAASSGGGKGLPGGMPGGTGRAVEAWPQKYAPTSASDIVANPGIVKQIRDWLTSWDDNFLHQPKGKNGKRTKPTSGKKAVLLSGPPGIGKTSTARILCQELGRDTLEVNASDARNKSDSKAANGMGGRSSNVVKEMIDNSALRFETGGPRPRQVLIMDEVDGMSGGDRGGVADLIASIGASRIPIICICNDRYSRKLQSLLNHCLPLNFRKPTKQQMAKRLRHVATQEKLDIPEVALEELAEHVNGDMRMGLNQLQYLGLARAAVTFADVQQRLAASAKDEDVRPMAAVDKLLGHGAGRLNLNERLDAAMSDIDLVPLMVQENYLNYRPAQAGPDEGGMASMELAARAADAISLGDHVNVQVRRYQAWQHLPFQMVMSSLLPGQLMHGQRQVLTQGEMNFNRFPGWLGKNSTAGKNQRLLEEVHSHIVASRLCEPSRLATRLDYLPPLVDRLTAPLKNLAKEEGAEEVGDMLEEYSLTLDDYDAILALSKFKGLPDPAAGIPSQSKGQLTKTYKKRSHKVKSSDLLPEVKVPGQKKKAGKRKLMGSKSGGLDVGELQADTDLPVAMEEGGDVEGDGNGDGDDEAEDADDEEPATAARLLAASSGGQQDDDTGGDSIRPTRPFSVLN